MTAIRVIGRLRQMPPSEVVARMRMRMRNEAGRVSWSLARPVWRRRDLARALGSGEAAIDAARRCLEASDAIGAHAALASHFASRPPRFVLDPIRRDELAGAILHAFPGAAADAARRAARILSGRLDLLGYRDLDVTTPAAEGATIDWHRDPVHDRRPAMAYWSRVPYLDPANGDHKIIWELNRHQHWMALGRAFVLTGDRRYRDRFVEELSSWMGVNPPLTGVNWSSMLELSLRCLSWIWALHFFVEQDEPAPRDPWLVDLLLGLDRQLSLVERNLSTYFSPNTHLLGEALALYVAGQSLPEMARAARWAATGRRTLLHQAGVQIGADGGHVELSPHYHRYALDFYLLALSVARTSGDADGAQGFENAVERLAGFARAVADDDWLLPRIGDDDGGMLLPMCGRGECDIRDSLALAAVLTGARDLFDGDPPEEVAWMTGGVPPRVSGPGRPRSIALASSGYFVSRTRRGDHLVMDAGPLGFLNGGHAHADALSVTLEVAGVPMLIDSGTGCYTVDAEMRDRFRSTAYHNTVTVNGRSQSEPAGPFRWASAARSTAHAWRSDAAFDFCDASHDGYRPAVHRRQVLSRPGCWIVWDWLLGEGSLEAAAHWHLAPSWSARLSGPAVRLDHADGHRVWMSTVGADVSILAGGSNAGPLGWYAPSYGMVLPTTTLQAVRSGSSPFVIVTVLVEGDDRPGVEPIAVAGGRAAAIEIFHASWREMALARIPADADPSGSNKERVDAGGLETDARALALRDHVDGRSEIWMVDGSTVRHPDGRRLVQLPAGASTLHVPGQSDASPKTAVPPEPARRAAVRTRAGHAARMGR